MALSAIFGLLPESICISLFIVYAKDVRNKRLPLFVSIWIVNLFLMILFAGSIWYHFTFIPSVYGVLFLYNIIRYRKKTHFIDIFLILAPCLAISTSSIICYMLIPNYWTALILNRMAIIMLPLLCKKPIAEWYIVYRSLWNRSQNKKIKSITLRNISLIALNLFLLISNVAVTRYLLWLNGGG